MKRQDYFLAIIAVFVSGFLSGCHSSDENLAPQSPNKPWQPEQVIEKNHYYNKI